jgi:hypothetical protein
MHTNCKALSHAIAVLLTGLALVCPTSSTAKDQVPFHGNANGAAVSASPDPGGVVLEVLARGRGTQLGRFSREETILFNPATGTITGLITFIAANGDQLFGTVEGGFVSPTLATGTYTFAGGTGRFENAVGEADFSLFTSDGVHFAVEFDGNLSSVGANKK